MWNSFKRVIRSGFVNFWRNGFVSFSTVLVMTTTLMVIGGIMFMSTLLNSALEEVQSKVDINVYFVTTALEEDILSFKRSLEALPEILSVEYQNRDQVLEAFHDRFRDDQTTLQALELLGENPLRAVFNIRAQETSQYEQIATFLDENAPRDESGISIIDDSNYFDNQIVITRLTRIIDTVKTFSVAVALVFVAMSVLITFNTIRLVIYISREEIAVMRLVGASTMYVRGPFVVGGMMYGFAAGILTLLVFYPITFWLGPRSEHFFSGLNLFTYYMSHIGILFLVIVCGGVLLGAISSYLAVRRYLKV